MIERDRWRDFQMPGRSVAYGVSGMAATSHPLSTLAALDMLRAGGNAVDAAIAAVAVQCVVEPAMTGIGGDCFALFAPASGGVVALNGSGHAPAAASIERILAAGDADQGRSPSHIVTAPGSTRISPYSPHAVTVPGAVAAWERLLAAHGTRGLDEVLAPAIGYAEHGFPVAPRVAFDWRQNVDVLRQSKVAEASYLPGGKAPPPGRIMTFPALARTLRAIASGGARAFYEGEIADAMVTTLRERGGLHDAADFASYQAEFVEPIKGTYRDVQVYECPPNGQGVVALLLMNILEGYDLSGMAPLGADRLHLLAEATKLAFRDRDRFVADPAMAKVPVDALLAKPYAAKLRDLIDPEEAKPAPAPLLDPHPDTVYLTVVDKDLNAVSFINSIYSAFGSGIACEKTGVLFHNRGMSFRFEDDHPNRIEGRKRPMHTIIPAMAFKGGETWMSYGVMGGNYQPVGHANVLSNLVDHGLDLQLALDAPRIMAYPGDLEVERGLSAAARYGLQIRGHRVGEAGSPLGGAQAIIIDRRRGVLVGASDFRKDGLAMGY